MAVTQRAEMRPPFSGALAAAGPAGQRVRRAGDDDKLHSIVKLATSNYRYMVTNVVLMKRTDINVRMISRLGLTSRAGGEVCRPAPATTGYSFDMSLRTIARGLIN